MPVGFSFQPKQLVVEAGDSTYCTVTVRNTGTVVERFTFAVFGAPGEWAELDPPAISLLPETERTVTLRFRPPRLPSVKAATVPFAVQVIPSEHPDDTVVEEGDLTVGPFSQMQAGLRPRSSRGATAGHHVLRVTNQGNVPIDAAISASDPDELLWFRVRPDEVHVPPGATAQVAIVVKPRRTAMVGPAATRPFQVRIAPAGAPPVSVDGSLVQGPILPRWLPRAAVAVAVLAIATGLYASRRARVTNVASVAASTTLAPSATGSAAPTTAPATTKATVATGPTTTASNTGATSAAAGVEPNLNPQALSCYTYDPTTLTSAPAPPNPTTSTSGPPRFVVSSNNPQTTMQFSNPGDAQLAQTVLSQYTQLCYIGKGGPTALQATTLEPYKAGLPTVPPGTTEKCDRYNTQSLVAEPPDSGHSFPWIADLSTNPPTAIQSFATDADAKAALALARAHGQRCWVGGAAKWTSLDDPSGGSVLEYWR